MADTPTLESLNEGDAELAALFKSLANDPATRPHVLRLVKHKNPNTPIPEIDMENRLHAVTKPLNDKIDAQAQELLKRDAKSNIDAHRSRLKEAGYGKDDIAAIEKLMVEKHIPSYDTAADHFRMSRELATPTPTTLNTGTYEMPVDRKLVKEAGGIKKWARQEAFAAAADIKAGRVKFH